ncbi:MAG: hypothetical protein AAF639_00120 [Chloroflexota bacterium]
MIGLWLGLSVVKTPVEVISTLQAWFPTLKIGDYEVLIESNQDWPPIVIWVSENKSEFPTGVSIELFPGPQDEGYEMPVVIELARRFAEAYDCQTICDGSGYGEVEHYPGYAIVWKDGVPYLADDYGSEFADQLGEPVRIIKPIQIDSTRNADCVKTVIEMG